MELIIRNIGVSDTGTRLLCQGFFNGSARATYSMACGLEWCVRILLEDYCTVKLIFDVTWPLLKGPHKFEVIYQKYVTVEKFGWEKQTNVALFCISPSPLEKIHEVLKEKLNFFNLLS